MRGLLLVTVLVAATTAVEFHTARNVVADLYHDASKAAKRSSSVEVVADGLRLKFNAFDEEFSFDLEPNMIYDENSKVTAYGENDEIIEEYRPVIRSFHSGDGNRGVRAFVYENGDIRGRFTYDGEVYSLAPVSHNEDMIPSERRRSLDAEAAEFVVYNVRDFVAAAAAKAEQPISFGTQNVATGETRTRTPSYGGPWPGNADQLSGSNTLIQPPPAPCPSQTRVLVESVAVDHQFYSKGSPSSSQFASVSAAEQDIQDKFTNWVEPPYWDAARIKFRLQDLIIKTAPSSEAWNPNSCQDINSKLDTFTAWRKQSVRLNDGANLWHLITSCYENGGTVGLAWIGVTCHKSSFGNGGGTGVSSSLRWGRGEPSAGVVTHEIGHNAGAPHPSAGTSGGAGLMSYNDYIDFSRESQQQICDHTSRTTCWEDDTNCVPSCSGKACGSDGCGSQCPNTCASQGLECNAATNQCIQPCVPNCAGKACGADGCGGECPDTCGSNEYCEFASATCKSPDDEMDLFLPAFNQARADNNVAALTWSSSLAAAAQTHSAACELFYPNTIYGYTFVAAIGAGSTAANNAVNDWVSQNYNCETDTCNSGSGQCNDYKQIIWEATTQVGCAYQAGCTVQSGGQTYTGVTLTTCYFNPAGNTGGRPTDNCIPVPTTQPPTTQPPTTQPPTTQPPTTQPPTTQPPTQPPACEPQTYAQACAGKQCGTVGDGCYDSDAYDCGQCSTNGQSVCNTQSHQCECQPVTSCAFEGKTCGSVNTGCGEETCGPACPTDPPVCNPTPALTCSNRGWNCDSTYNGCEWEECGSCSSDYTCQQGVCTTCPPCGANAQCNLQSLECECLDGFTAGTSGCEPITGGNPQFTPITGNWRVYSGSVHHDGAAGKYHDLIEWDAASSVYSTTRTVLSIVVTRNAASTKAGVAFLVSDDGTQYWFVDLDGSEVTIGYIVSYYGYQYERRYGLGGFSLPVGGNARLDVVLYGNNIDVNLNGNLVRTISVRTPRTNSRVGLAATNSAMFTDAAVATSTTLTIELAQCMDSNALAAAIASLLGVPLSQIQNVDVNCDSGRREAATATFTLVGSPAVSSTAMTSSFNAALGTGTGMSSVGISTGAATTAAVPVANAIGALVITETALVGLSAAAIAGIAVGGVALTGAAGAGGYATYRYYDNKKQEEKEVAERENPTENPLYGREVPKVDVMNPDADKHMSLTARQIINVE